MKAKIAGLLIIVSILVFLIYGLCLIQIGMKQTDLPKSIQESLNAKPVLLDSVELGAAKVFLFQSDDDKIGYAVFNKIGFLKRYKKEKIYQFEDFNRRDHEFDVVDDGWSLYVIELTPTSIEVANTYPWKGRYVKIFVWWLAFMVCTFVIVRTIGAFHR